MERKLTFTKETSFLRSKLWRCCWQHFVLTLFIATTVLFSFTLTAQNIQGTVPVLAPTGGFGIDGDAFANTPSPAYLNVGDWFYETGGTGTGVLNTDGSPIDGTMTFLIGDDWGKADRSTFLTSTKIDDNPNTYLWGPANNLLAKNDMQNVGAHFAYTGANDTGDLWCIFAADRQVVNGDAYIDFEFLQKPLTITGATYNSYGTIIGGNGKFESQGTDGGRTLGDVLVTLIFTNGGTSAEVEIRIWEAVGTGYEYVLHPNTEFTGSIFATNNNSVTTVPFNVYGTQPGVYAPNQWAEGAINLSTLLKIDENPCATLATMFVRTKTSQSPSAELKDFPGIFQLNLDLSPTIEITGNNITCNGGETELTATLSPGFESYTFEYEWFKDGNLIPSQTGTTLTVNEGGTYSIKATIVLVGIPIEDRCFAEDDIVIVEPPLLECEITSFTYVSCFQGNDGAATVVANGGTAPYTYLWSDAGAQTSATATGLMAGLYSVLVTDANGCETECNVTISEPPELTCIASNSGEVCVGENITLSVTGSGGTGVYTYLWTSNGVCLQTNLDFSIESI